MRINYRNGFDLDSKKGTDLLVNEIKTKHQKLAWVSMVCTRMSSLQNLTQRTPEQQDRFLKRKGQDLRRCDDVVTGLEQVLQHEMIWLGNGQALRSLDGDHDLYNDYKGSSSATTGRYTGSTLMDANMVWSGVDGLSRKLGPF